MQQNIKTLNCLSFLVIILFCGSNAIGVMAQSKLPISLQNNTVLSPVNKETYDAAATDYRSNRGEEKRNRLIFMAISQIDLHFGGYVKEKRQRNAFFQTVLDILEVGAATAISITNGERSKSIIADALGFVQGSRTKVNKNLRLLEQQVLVNKMIEKRSLVLAEIYKKSNESDAQYPFERAYIDILAYYQAGTTDSALSSLATDSGTSATDAQTKLAIAKRNANILLAPTAAQIKTSNENANFVQAIIDSHVSETAKITAADAAIAAATASIAAENAKVAPLVPNAGVIATATAAKASAESNKTNAKAAQKIAEDKLKAIFNAIERDIVLAPLLDELPEKYPGLATSIQQRLERIRSKNGTTDDYASIILKFFGLVTEAVLDNPTVVERAKNIVDSVK